MPALSPTTLSVIRDGHPHHEEFHLSIFKPVVVYTGHVTGPPARGATVVTVTDVSGNIANVYTSYTLIVFDPVTNAVISKRRVRAVIGHDFTIDENNVLWTTSMYIKVINYFELWSIFPYIDPTTLIFYKALNTVYTNQNSFIPPVAIIDAERVKFLDGASVSCSISASRSYTMAGGATIVSYAWTCLPATVTAPTSANTTVVFTVAGQYWLTLTVTDSNGVSQYTRKIIFIHTRTGSNAPYLDFSMDGIDTSLNDGGANFNIEVHGVADTDTIADDAYVILSSEQYYGDDEHYYGEYDNMICDGYIRADSIKRDFGAGFVSFTVETIQGMLKKRKMVSISIEESSETANWYRFPVGTLTVARAIHHYLKWHSTLFDICNVFLPIDDTKTFTACDDFEAGTLYDMAANFARQYSIFAYTCCTLGGDLYVAKDINTLTDGGRAAIVTHFDITAVDRLIDPDLEIMHRIDNVSSVIVSGVSKDTFGNPVPIISICPGDVPDTYGNSEIAYERQVIEDQNQANFLSGRMFAIENTDIQEVRLALAGNYPVDVMPQEWYTISDNANKRIDMDVKFIINSMHLSLDIMAGTRRVEMILIPEAVSVIGDGITSIPPEPDIPTDPPAPNWPPIEFPKFPPLPRLPNPGVPPVILYKCGDDTSPNGPWQLFGAKTLDSIDGPTLIVRSNFAPGSKLRAVTDPNPSSITITGDFFEDDVLSSSNNFYEVTALDYGMNVVAEAIMTGTGRTRTGIFNNAAPVTCWFIQIELLIHDGTDPFYTSEGLEKLEISHTGYGIYDVAPYPPAWSGKIDAVSFYMEQYESHTEAIVFDLGYTPDVNAGLYVRAKLTANTRPVGGGALRCITSADNINWRYLGSGVDFSLGVWGTLSSIFGDQPMLRYVGFVGYQGVSFPEILSYGIAYAYITHYVHGLNTHIDIDSMYLYNVCR